MLWLLSPIFLALSVFADGGLTVGIQQQQQLQLTAWRERINSLHGPRVALPRDLDARAYRNLFGEPASARTTKKSLFVVVLHCGKHGREHMVERWRTGYLANKAIMRHVGCFTTRRNRHLVDSRTRLAVAMAWHIRIASRSPRDTSVTVIMRWRPRD